MLVIERPKIIPSSELPERFQELDLDFWVGRAQDVPEAWVQQLCDKSRQHHVRKNEGHEDIGTKKNPGRFRDRDSYYAWAESRLRIMGLPINQTVELKGAPDIASAHWKGEKTNPHIPDSFEGLDVSPAVVALTGSDFDVTLGVRNYRDNRKRGWKNYYRVGLGAPLFTAARQHVGAYFPGSHEWLDLVDGNRDAQNLYERSGFEVVARYIDEHDPKIYRLAMVNPEPFVGEA